MTYIEHNFKKKILLKNIYFVYLLSILLKLKKRKKYYSFAPYIGTKIQIHIDNK